MKRNDPNYIPAIGPNCEHCSEVIDANYEFITDSDKFAYCNEECFKEYYGYKEVAIDDY
jgi:hypothetical protein